MLNEQFKKMSSNVKVMDKRGASIFGLFVSFAIPMQGQGHEAMRAETKMQEKLATAEMKVELGKNSTYKVAKNLILNCVEAGISLTDADGKSKGKTQLEDELAATKSPKSPLEKFKAVMAAADKIAATLTDGECITAASLADTLFKSVAVRIKAAA